MKMRRPQSCRVFSSSTPGGTLPSSTLPQTAVTGAILFELPQHPQIADVSRVEDVAHAFERAGNLGIKLPVGVGNDSDEILTHGLPFR